MSSLGSSELILNPDGSIYHLNLLPEDIAETIITVGDPERVHEVRFTSVAWRRRRQHLNKIRRARAVTHPWPNTKD